MDTAVAIEDPRDDRRARTHRLADGTTIGYAEYGAPHGEAVIALHGTPGSRLMFALADRAARDRGLRIIAPDRPGYGLSTYRRSETLLSLAHDVEDLADALRLDRFVLIGVSGGGPHAVAAAASMPERTRLLALAGPVGPIAECREDISLSKMHRLIFTGPGRSPLVSAAVLSAMRGLVRFAPDIAYGGLMRRAIPADRAVLARPEAKANLLAAIGEGLRPGVKGAVQDLRLYCAPWRLDLSNIHVPAILWQGSDDPVVPAQAAYYLAEALPHCRLDMIEDGGHYWVFDRFGMMLDAISRALRAS
jgi:pimeloyl-ACP methyl ester carboxylesterase